jgi:hypothetical protein
MKMSQEFERIANIGWKYLSRHEKEVFKLYKCNLQLFRKVLAEAFEKYAVDGKLYYSEMAKYNRLASLLAFIVEAIKRMYKAMIALLNKAFGNLFVDSYFRAGYLLEMATRTRLGYMAVRPEVVKAAVQNPISGLTLNERLEKHRAELIMKLRETITIGLVRGSSYKEMVNGIKNDLEGDVVKARRIIRTEGHRVMSSGVHQSVLHATSKGIIMVKRWLHSKDSRVRDSHEKMGAKEPIPATEDFVNEDTGGKGPCPGQMGKAADDVNCRCVAVYEIVAVERKQHDKFEKVSYEEWKKGRMAA